ncbi:hypothetical protein GCM10009552_24730 [Rothia nasimurium]
MHNEVIEPRTASAGSQVEVRSVFIMNLWGPASIGAVAGKRRPGTAKMKPRYLNAQAFRSSLLTI